uniref:Protein krueppel n=1 Tax=Anopheles christyi TaxID=43041 RepID=A0A182JZV4_9DIPT
MEECCRLCTDDNPVLTSIANHRVKSTVKASAVSLEDLIEQYLAISIYPSTIEPLICAECLKRIEEWHSFHESCQQHERFFQQQKIRFEEVITTELKYELETIECVSMLERETQDNEMEPDDSQEVDEEEDGIQMSSEGEDSTNVPIVESKSTRNTRASKVSRRAIARHEIRKPTALKEKRGLPKSLRESGSRTKPKHLNVPSDQSARKQRPVPKICTICGVARTDMAAHMRWHNNERPYQCLYCPKIFLNSSNLKNHINLHTREKMYKCDLCDKEFPSTTGRSKHRETHATERTHLCAVCGKSFKYRASLARHKLIHFEEPKEKCSECDMIFLTKTRLSKHFMVHMNVKPFSCEVCGRAFNRKDNLKTHMKTHAAHRKRDKKHEDDIVVPKEDIYQTKSEADYLEETILEDGYNYEVLFTDTESESAGGSCTKPKPRKRRSFCTICGKYLYNLAEHRRMHLNIRLQECPHCGKTFVHRTNLIAHLNIHTHDRIYKCEYCGSEFISVQGLKQHRATHFEGQHACSICHRKYSRKCYLILHKQRVHMPKERHRCLICDRQFLNPTRKEEHMKIHEDGTLHECSVCHRAYNAKRNLLRHIRTAHPQERAER